MGVHAKRQGRFSGRRRLVVAILTAIGGLAGLSITARSGLPPSEKNMGSDSLWLYNFTTGKADHAEAVAGAFSRPPIPVRAFQSAGPPTWDSSAWLARFSNKSLGQIMEESKKVYLLDVLTDSAAAALSAPPPAAIDPSDYVVVEQDNGDRLLQELILPSEYWDDHLNAEALFRAGDYDIALDEYRRILAAVPSHTYFYTLIGDAFFNMGRYDSAAWYFGLAIERNFIDYRAHWFLADALRALGDTVAAVRELTVAHVLNPSHPVLKNAMIAVRNRAGLPWSDWTLRPLSDIRFRGDTVHLMLHQDWMVYTLVKALYLAEPGYGRDAQPDTGTPADFNPSAEMVALSIWAQAPTIAPDTSLARARVNYAIANNHLLPLVYYELLAHRYPIALRLLSPGTIGMLANYVLRYH